jgi:hypothetical protein
MRTAVSTAALAAAIQLILPVVALGQFTEYTQPGTASTGREVVERETLDEAIEEARWQLGPVRVEPWAGIRDVSWNDNPGGGTEGSEGDGDVSAAAGAGIRSYLPVGPDVVVSAHALPEYSWWGDQEDRRRVNGRYGAGVFGFFNRLTLQATARRTEQLAILSYEVPEQGNTRTDDFAFATEVELGFSTSVFTEVGRTRIRNLLEEEERTDGGAPFQLLDRDEDRLRAGVRYRPRERWSFAVGMEWTEADFTNAERDLSSSGEAPLVEVLYQGPRFFASARAEHRSLEPLTESSSFPESETTTYGLQLGLEGNRISPVAYARRSLGLAITPGYSFLTTDVVGLATTVSIGRRTEVRVFGETGTTDFERISGEVPAREDDLTAFGGEIGFRIGRSLSFRLGGYRADFDSALPGLDRSVTRFGTGLTLGLGGEEAAGWP